MMKTIDRNRTKYEAEKESRDKHLKAYADAIQNMVQNSTTEVVKELVTERKRQGMTQQELADITGILPPNLARIESGKHIPTLVVLEKYASALGKHIEIKVCDD